jgi:hypothetical protein
MLCPDQPTQTVRKQMSSDINDLFKDCLCRLKLSPKNVELPVFEPSKLLQLATDKFEWFGKLLVSHMKQQPPSVSKPWNLVLYHDEIACGNVLKKDNQRKATAFYLSFLEFKSFLRDEDAWLCFAVVPKPLLLQIDGGLSVVVKELIRFLFQREAGLSRSGALIAPKNEEAMILVARMSHLIADESALKATLCAKGSSGIKPCLQCKNIVCKGSLASHDRTGYLKNISCHDPADFDLASDADMWELADALGRFVGSKAELDKLEKASGLNAVEVGILRELSANSTLRACTCV